MPYHRSPAGVYGIMQHRLIQTAFVEATVATLLRPHSTALPTLPSLFLNSTSFSPHSSTDTGFPTLT